VGVVVVAVALLGGGAGIAVATAGGSGTTPSASRIRFTRRPSGHPTTSLTRPGPPPPYPVTLVQLPFIDPSRSTAARGGQPAHPGRTLVTTIYVPTTPAVGPFPLVLFAHGFNQSTVTYAGLLRTVAAGGYVVAAPDFPLTSTAFPGPAVRSDVLNEPADVSFLITAISSAAAQPGPLQGQVAPGKAAVMGHSDGAVTAAAVAFNSCCVDARVGAAVVLSGAESQFRGSWFGHHSPALLVVHGDADTVNPLPSGQLLYAGSTGPAFLVTVNGGTHLGPFTTDPVRTLVGRVIVDFLDSELEDDGSAGPRLQADGNVAGVLTMP